MSGYIIAPLDLTERQMLIYMCLYKKCNFENMNVNCTTQQIITDIKIIDLSVKVVNGEIKKMIDKGYLNLIKKGSKGNFSVYEIIKMNELESGNLKATNRQVKGKLKASDSNASTSEVVTNREVKGNLKANPIKEKEKENIYIDEIWGLYPNKQGKKMASTKIPAIIKSIGKDKLIECIGNYMEHVEEQRKGGFATLQYMNGSTFFNGRYLDYMEKQKTPIGVGANKNNKSNSSICNTYINNTPKIEGTKFI